MSAIICVQWCNCVSRMISGGAKRILSLCVGFASKPLSASRKHIASASNSSCISIALSKPEIKLARCNQQYHVPFPRTSLMISFGNLFSSLRSFSPCRIAFSSISRPSKSSRFSNSASNAVVATAHASGFPPYVEPCCPG